MAQLKVCARANLFHLPAVSSRCPQLPPLPSPWSITHTDALLAARKAILKTKKKTKNLRGNLKEKLFKTKNAASGYNIYHTRDPLLLLS